MALGTGSIGCFVTCPGSACALRRPTAARVLERCPAPRLVASRRPCLTVFSPTRREHTITATAKRVTMTRGGRNGTLPYPLLAQPKMKRRTTVVSSTSPATNASAASVVTAAMRANRQLRCDVARRDRLRPLSSVRRDPSVVHCRPASRRFWWTGDQWAAFPAGRLRHTHVGGMRRLVTRVAMADLAHRGNRL